MAKPPQISSARAMNWPSAQNADVPRRAVSNCSPSSKPPEKRLPRIVIEAAGPHIRQKLAIGCRERTDATHPRHHRRQQQSGHARQPPAGSTPRCCPPDARGPVPAVKAWTSTTRRRQFGSNDVTDPTRAICGRRRKHTNASTISGEAQLASRLDTTEKALEAAVNAWRLTGSTNTHSQ